jgi:hypothetical protein
LSISSSSTTGFIEPASRIARTIRPGSAPTVGAPVAADLGLVAHAAEGDADELAIQRAGHGLTQRRLADTGRPDQGHHRAGPAAADGRQAAAVAPRPDGQELDQPLLDVVQPRVVGVEHGPGGDEVVAVVGALVPRDVQDRVEPGADPARLRVLLRAALELVDLLEGGLQNVLGQVGGLDAGAVVVRALRLALAQLLADRRELLAQQELPLLLLHALADVLADLLADLLLGDVLLRPAEQQLEPLLDVGLRQQLRLLDVVEVGRPAGEIGERTGVRRLLDESMTCHALRCCRIDTTSALYSFASSSTRPVGAGSVTFSASTHRAAPGPVTPDPMRARISPRTTAAFSPLGSRPTCSRTATVPTAA